jgi:hypothetical protein
MHGLTVLAAVGLGTFAIVAFHGHSLAADVTGNYVTGARDLFAGRSPYHLADIARGTVFGSPPIVGVLFAPLLVIPTAVAEVVAAIATLLCLAGTIWVLGVRDWRCYVVAAVWYPTLFEFQSGNLSALLALLVAISWRFRDRWSGVAAVAVAVALKLYCWPLIVFLLVTRRVRAAAAATAGSVALVLVPWAAFGFVGLRAYPHLLDVMTQVEQREGFSLAGAIAPIASWSVARMVAYAVGAALLIAAYRVRGEENRFLLCIAAMLALTPILWMHYFVVLLVVAALAQPRLGAVWLMPLALWIAPHAPQAPHGRPENIPPAWQAVTVAAIVAAVFATASARLASARPTGARLPVKAPDSSEVALAP